MDRSDDSEPTSAEPSGRHTFARAPLRGHPELRWAGKRPFRSVAAYPAQLRESYAGTASGPPNELYWGDNLQVMSHLLGRYRGRIGLIYLDPPFDSKADYKKRIKLRGKAVQGSHGAFEEKQYSDIWSHDEYLQFMYERLILSRELLKPEGNLVVHCDWRVSGALRMVLDEVFGPTCFRNQLVWSYGGAARGAKARAKQFARNHDDLLWYSRSASGWTFSPVPVERRYSREEARKKGFRQDEDGRWFKTAPRGDYSDASIQRLEAEGRVHRTRTGKVRIKYFLDSAGGQVTERMPVGDVWTDIPDAMHLPLAERTGYPTQKPEALVARLIQSLSLPGDVVADFFMGSGTTPSAAASLGRPFVGCDINQGALDTATRRLAGPGASEPRPPLQVFTVNRYDLFRNPVQARALLLEALGVRPAPAASLYDGELDGRKVKLLPVDRIASRPDLEPLLAGFPYARFEARRAAHPSRPVERILLVCMGHEPGLKEHLIRASGHRLDVELVDILRDRSDLQFRRESEAELVVEEGELQIRAFYPMDLLQKLAADREEVGEWRELVDAVLIDFDYDGSVLRPAVVDVPERNAWVRGRYPVPEGSGTIRVRITDLLSESWEGELVRG